MQNKNTKETKKIDLHPKKCNICGGLVIYTNNNLIYGKSYGSLLNQTEKGVIPYPSETRLGDGEKRYSPGKLKIVAISSN